MTQAMADAFPEQLTRDLAFILDLDNSPPSPTRRPLAIPALGSVTASASIGFSALAVLVAGTAVTLADWRPSGGERETAAPSPESRVTSTIPTIMADAPAPPRATTLDIAAAPAPTIVAAAIERTTTISRATVIRTAAVGSSDRVVASARPPVRARDRAGTRVAARADRVEVAATMAVRPPTPIRESAITGLRSADPQVVRTPPVALATTAGALGTPPRAASAPAATMAMNPATIPVARLRAARRDAQDALIGLRRQL
jgi:hypothetical protein